MQISFNWLKQYLPDLNLSVEETAALLTDIGLEVEAVEDFETVKGGLQGLVVGHVMSKTKHPDADKLSVTMVDVDGSGVLHQIVCGAPNVDAGQKVIVALPGTTIFPINGEPFKIKLSKIRGVESAGMLCAEDEIGLGVSHDGIKILDASAKVGDKVAHYFNVSADKVIHIGLTPNRIDAASHIGVARELRAALKQRQKIELSLVKPVFAPVPSATNPYSVEIEQADACHKYIAIEIKNVQVSESPAWLKNRLESIGLRSINSVVDATNFVMMETGQPLHAFDGNKIGGHQIKVRLAKQDEPFITLDGKERKLNANDLVIADDTKPMCIAGVFGGIDSGVTMLTTNIVLEAAWFNPVYIRKTARRHELFTDSSFRFERGVDPVQTLEVAQRAARLILELAGGEMVGYTLRQAKETSEASIDFELKSFTAFTGYEISLSEVKSILTDLDFIILEQNDTQLKLKAPAYRVDVIRTIDVYEEILRIYGYNNIPIGTKTNATPQLVNGIYGENFLESVSGFLEAKGLHEIMNNSLIPGTNNGLTGLEEQQFVKLLNPLSNEMDVMRSSLLFGGLASISYNTNRQLKDLAFFEVGKIYTKYEDKYKEESQIGIWLTGQKAQHSWTDKAGDVNYYTMRGIVESLLSRYVKTSLALTFPTEDTMLYDVFKIQMGNDTLVTGGLVKPHVLGRFDLDKPVCYASVSVKVFMEAVKRTKFKYKEVSKFPIIKRDLSLLMDHSVGFDSIKNTVLQTDKQLIKDVTVFDVYVGKNLPEGKKSYAISLTITDENKTMRDEEVEKLMDKVIKNLGEKAGAVLR